MPKLVTVTGIILLIIFSLTFSIFPQQNSKADGTYANLGTTDASDGSSDAVNFSQGGVWTIDKYGKYIWMTQNRVNPTHHWAWSNNQGATWTQGSEGYDFLARASVAYDSINDKLHVIWAAQNASDGIIYRRYGITRDGSNNITAITREDSSNINLQLDTSSSRVLEQPVAIWVNDGSTNGSLIAIWSKHGSSLAEVRGSMRHLSLSSADGSAGNWVALDGSGDTFATDPPAVAADKIFSAASGAVDASAIIRGGSGTYKDDLYVFAAETATSSILSYRAAWNSSSLDFSNGWQSPVTVGSFDNSSGYSLKYQLITKPVLDSTNDRLYVGWPRWKDGTSGDTDSIAYLDSSNNASSTFNVYSANGTHSYAPTMDIAYDATLDQVYIAYIESTTNGDNGSIDYKTFDGSSLGSENRFYTSPGGSSGADGSADIPVLYANRSSNDRLLFAFRINGALPPTSGDPHTIDWGYITLATPTNTPTPTPTSTPTPTPSASTSFSAPGPAGPPACLDSPPSSPAPWLYAATALDQTSIEIYFTSAHDPYTKYILEYGLSADNYIYSSTNIGGPGTTSYIVSALSPNTTYYFRVMPANGCASGDWSNELSASTKLHSQENSSQIVATTDPGSSANPAISPSPTVSPTTQLPNTAPNNSLPAQAAGITVKIKVVDQLNQPLSGVQVNLHSETQTIYTDSLGIAQFNDVEPGNHQVEIIKNGQTETHNIDVSATSPDFNLTIQYQAQTNYLLIGGIALALLIIGGIVYLTLKRKNTNPAYT